jgi:hypothetical protein
VLPVAEFTKLPVDLKSAWETDYYKEHTILSN